jgi:hypothetical protein
MFGSMAQQAMQRQALRAMQQARFAHYAQRYAEKGWRLIDIYEPRRGEMTIRVERPTTIPRVNRGSVSV